MNKVILIGRATRDPEVHFSRDPESTKVARYTLAVDRRGKKEGDQQSADFISCVCFGRAADFVDKYVRKGTKLAIVGRIQTGSYTKQDGSKVYTTDVVVEEHEFAESKNSNVAPTQETQGFANVKPDSDGFMHVPDGIDEDLPFN